MENGDFDRSFQAAIDPQANGTHSDKGHNSWVEKSWLETHYPIFVTAVSVQSPLLA